VQDEEGNILTNTNSTEAEYPQDENIFAKPVRPLGIGIISIVLPLSGLVVQLSSVVRKAKGIQIQDISGVFSIAFMVLMISAACAMIGVGIWQGRKLAWLFVILAYADMLFLGSRTLIQLFTDGTGNISVTNLFVVILNTILAIFVLPYFCIKRNVRKFYGFKN
jgi:hypothetical protein